MFTNENFQGIAWIDVEATGLNPYLTGEKLLQVACYVTDPDLNILDEVGFEMPVFYSEQEVHSLYENTSKYVQNMHDSTGLWGRLSTEGVPLEDVDRKLVEYVSQFYPNPRTAWLGGNSISLDRNFLTAYLPETDSHLHYRSVDVTSWAGPVGAWTGFLYEKKRTHDAKDDIMESIEELKAIRNLIFNR